jgi:hypothetical protein
MGKCTCYDAPYYAVHPASRHFLSVTNMPFSTVFSNTVTLYLYTLAIVTPEVLLPAYRLVNSINFACVINQYESILVNIASVSRTDGAAV